MKANLKEIVILCPSKENSEIVYNSIISEYKFVEVSKVSELIKEINKKSQSILAIVLDASNALVACTDYLEQRKNNFDYQIIPVIGIIKAGDRVSESTIRQLDVSNIIHTPINSMDFISNVKSIAKRYAIDKTRIEEMYNAEKEAFESKLRKELKDTKDEMTQIIGSLNAAIFVIEFTNVDDVNSRFKVSLKNKLADELFDDVDIDSDEFFNRLSTEDQLSFIKNLNEAVDDEGTHSFNMDFNYYSGETKNLNISIRHIHCNDKVKLVCSAFDRTNDEINRKELEDSSTIIQTIYDCLDTGLCIVSLGKEIMNIDYANGQFYDLTGYDKDDDNILSNLFSEKTNNLFYKASLQKAQNEETVNELYSYKNIVLYRKDGTTKNINIKAKIVSYDGLVLRCLVMLIDNTKDLLVNKQIKYMADYDSESNLYNNTRFCQLSEKMVQTNDEEEYQLVVLKLYHYRALVSIFGKSKIDDLIKIIGEGLHKICPKAIKGRVEFDTFALCGNVKYLDYKVLMKKLDEYVAQNYKTTKVTFYYGIYGIDDPYLAMESMIVRTIYAIKEIVGSALKNMILVDSKLRFKALQKDAINNDMEAALQNHEFEVFLQPIFDINTRKIVSAEALTRWHHPKRGYISPLDYVPVSEENGFIVNIDDYVWRTVCELLRSWIDEGRPLIPISVNVSRIDIFNINFYDRITSLVEQFNIPPRYLRLEITESAYIEGEETIIDLVNKLRYYGFTVLMDDFGSGYSSLNSLKDICVDILKIDMELVRGMESNPRTACILKSVIELGKSLELSMICEGVEKESQAEFISSCGCSKAQGWLFSKAVAIPDFIEMLDKEAAQ